MTIAFTIGACAVLGFMAFSLQNTTTQTKTKEQWGDIQEKGPTIILNIHRDEVIIEG